MQFQILRTAAAMRPTVRAAKACWPKQLQRINYASLAKTKAHIRTHMARISVSHTHTQTDALVCTFQSSFATFICIRSKVAQQNCCIRWLRLSCGLPSAGLANEICKCRISAAVATRQMPVQCHTPSAT